MKTKKSVILLLNIVILFVSRVMQQPDKNLDLNQTQHSIANRATCIVTTTACLFLGLSRGSWLDY